MRARCQDPVNFDAIIVGAGVGGLYATWWIAVPRVKSKALPPTSKTGIGDTRSGQKFRGYPQRIPFVRAQMIEGLCC